MVVSLCPSQKTTDTGEIMNRTLQSVALGLAACAAALSVPSAATAAPETEVGPISATASPINFGGNPWVPTGTLTVKVHNAGAEATEGYFLLDLPVGAELIKPELCETSVDYDWTVVCGGDKLPAGGEKTYHLAMKSDVDGVLFDVKDRGFVAGSQDGGKLGARTQFAINWPRKAPLRLAVTKGGTADSNGTVSVDVKVTNIGTSTIGGYSLAAKLPKGVKITRSCDPKLNREGASCEVYRGKALKAGAVDSFSLTTTVVDGPKKVTFYLTPSARYTNKDTAVTLKLGGPVLELESATAGSGGGAELSQTAAELPKTGVDTGVVAAGGAGLLGLGGLIFAVTRRRITFS